MTNEERNVMGKNGLEASSREFDRSMLMDKLEGWIEQMVNQTRQKARAT
jgi:hypothetical protein